jgi:AcrR family transcriptional regulator
VSTSTLGDICRKDIFVGGGKTLWSAMPRIRTATLEDHRDAAWSALIKGLERLLAEKSYEEISVAEIAAAAGMARNTIYNYASDKAALVAQAAERSNQGLLDHVTLLADGDESPPLKIAAIMAAVIQWYGESDHRPLLIQTLFRPVPNEVYRRAGAPLEKTAIPVAHVVQQGIETGFFVEVDDIDLIVDLLAGAVTRAAIRAVNTPETIETVSREMAAFALRALGHSGEITEDPR